MHFIYNTWGLEGLEVKGQPAVVGSFLQRFAAWGWNLGHQGWWSRLLGLE